MSNSFKNIKGNVSIALQADLATISVTTIPEISGNVNTISGNINTISSNVNTISGNVNILSNTTIPALTNNVNTLSNTTGTLTNNMDNVIQRLNVEITDRQQLADNLEQAVDDLETHDNALCAGITAVDGKVDLLNDKVNLLSAATKFRGVVNNVNDVLEPKAGDIVITKDGIEYIYSNSEDLPNWQEIGNEDIVSNIITVTIPELSIALTSLISSTSAETLLNANTYTDELSIALTSLISSTSAETLNQSKVYTDDLSTSLSTTVNTLVSSTSAETLNQANTYTKALSTALSGEIKSLSTALSNEITSLSTALSNEITSLSTALSNEITSLNNTLTGLISSTSAETLLSANNYTDTIRSGIVYTNGMLIDDINGSDEYDLTTEFLFMNNNTGRQYRTTIGFKAFYQNKNQLVYTYESASKKLKFLILSKNLTSSEINNLSNTLTGLISSTSAETLLSANNYTDALSNVLTGEINDLNNTLTTDYATMSYVDNKVDEILQQLTGIIDTI